MTISEFVMDVAQYNLDLTLDLLRNGLEDIPQEPDELELHVSRMESLVWFAKEALYRDCESKRTALEVVLPLCTKVYEFVKGYEAANKQDIYSKQMYDRLVSIQAYAMGRSSTN